MNGLIEHLRAKGEDLHPYLRGAWDDFDEVWTIKHLDGLRVSIKPLMYTSAILIGPAHDITNAYDDRWCYKNTGDALSAALAWTGPYPGTEPTGWHRHPDTGRRRENGDPSTEKIWL